MKKKLLLLGLTINSLFALNQNSSPVVNIQNIVVDDIQEQVIITYNLADLDDDECDVWLKAALNGDDFFTEVNLDELSGDIGTSVSPGSDKTIVWNYSELPGTINIVKIRLYASDNKELDVHSMVNQVDSNLLLQNLSYLEGIRHFSAAPDHLDVVRDSIEANFYRYGLATERHLFSYQDNEGVNILGRKSGAKDEAITFIIDGHYDGVPNSPAADDNGTAVAGMLEVLRIVSQYEFEHSIRFIGFDFEELGLIGSNRYVQNGIASYEDIQGVLNLEMIGYKSDEPNSQTLPDGFEIIFPDAVDEIAANEYRGDFLVVCGNDNSSSLITDYINASEQYVPDLKTIRIQVAGNGEIAPDLRRSDHTPFWESGRKALMLTDGADTRNQNYHTMGDSIGTLDFDFMTNVVKATLGTLAELAVPISAGHDEFDLATLAIEHNHSHSPSIEVFPNPTNGEFIIKIDAQHNLKQRLDVYNLQGQVVETKIFDVQHGSSSHSIDLTNLNSGKYILIFKSKEGELSKSLIIE